MSQVESICWEEDTKYAEEVMLNRNTNNQQSFKNAWQMAEGKKKKGNPFKGHQCYESRQVTFKTNE